MSLCIVLQVGKNYLISFLGGGELFGLLFYLNWVSKFIWTFLKQLVWIRLLVCCSLIYCTFTYHYFIAIFYRVFYYLMTLFKVKWSLIIKWDRRIILNGKYEGWRRGESIKSVLRAMAYSNGVCCRTKNWSFNWPLLLFLRLISWLRTISPTKFQQLPTTNPMVTVLH
jgi:hypothetical protein